MPLTQAPPKNCDAPHQSGAHQQDIGINNDGLVLVSGIISSAEGSFPSVTGVTSETDSVAGTPNTYSLQLNTNGFSTSLCNGNPNPTCAGAVQFVYSTNGAIYIQYWLNNWGPSACPTTLSWIKDSGGCRLNGGVMNTPAVPITSLGNLTLTGTTVSGGMDTVTFWTGTHDVYGMAGDNILGSSQLWTNAEFNVFGNGSRAQAVFNDGATIAVKIGVTYGGTASPSSVVASHTAETNNLNLVPGSICSVGGASPALTLVETRGTTITAPFCLLNDIVPILTPLL